MPEKTAQEFHYGAGLALAVTGAEGDGAVTDPQQAVIADADAMRVAPEILEHMFGAAEGGPTVDDPAAAVESVAQGFGYSAALRAEPVTHYAHLFLGLPLYPFPIIEPYYRPAFRIAGAAAPTIHEVGLLLKWSTYDHL
jgi:hypothetical protein